MYNEPLSSVYIMILILRGHTIGYSLQSKLNTDKKCAQIVTYEKFFPRSEL